MRLGHCGKAVHLLIELRFKPQLWPKDFGNDQKNEIADTLFGGWPKGTR